MQNEMITSGGTTPARTIEQITADLYAHAQMTAAGYIAMGKDLADAKTLLGHGNFLPWLKQIGMNPKTAQNYMNLAAEVNPDSMIAFLPYSKALALLDVPAEQREQFARENDIADKSAAAIKKLIKERDQERARADSEAAAKEEAQQTVKDLGWALEQERGKQQKVVEKPVEVKPADYDDLKARVENLTRRAEEAEEAAAAAEERAAAAVSEAQRAQMQQLDEEDEGRTSDDFLSLADLVSVCNEFTSKTWAVPFMGDVFRECDDETLRGYRLFVNGIRSWAERTLAAIDDARPFIKAEGVIIVDDNE